MKIRKAISGFLFLSNLLISMSLLIGSIWFGFPLGLLVSLPWFLYICPVSKPEFHEGYVEADFLLESVWHKIRPEKKDWEY